MIKRYKLFKESNDSVDLNKEFSNFLETLKECEDYYKDENFRQFDSSYSRTAQNGRTDNNNNPFDPDEDYRLVSDFMKEKGWPDERIENLFINLPDVRRKVYLDNPCACAPIDYFLFQITDEDYPLQGYKWEITDEVDEYNEDDIFIKFGYGWHKTKYGVLCIKQNFGTMEQYFKYCLDGAVEAITNEFIEERIGENNNIKDQIKNCIIPDKDMIRIYIDTEDLKNLYDTHLMENEGEDEEHKWTKDSQSQKEFDIDIINICKSTLSAKAKSNSPGDVIVTFK